MCRRELPVVNRVTAEHRGEINVIAVAGRSSLERSMPAAEAFFDDHVRWAYDEELWQTYGILSQPITVLINPDRSFAGDCDSLASCSVYGFSGEEGVRENVARLLG
ncbi:MAG: hypothetical protein HKO10_03830 [Acidimicrobiia bacterium]|nr:hypothetical protein [Acidimicrobiia bacterium]